MGHSIIAINNHDYNIDQNNHEYDFCHNRAVTYFFQDGFDE